MSDPAPSRRPAAAPSWGAAVLIALAVTLFARRPLAPALPRGEHAAFASASAGTEADGPTDLTIRDWREILRRVITDLGDDRVLAVAAGVAFYGLLAIVPAITALVSLFGLVADPATISDQLASLNNILPSGALDIIGEQVKRIAAKPHGSLGFGFAAGLAVALWSTNAGMKAMFDALNVVYAEKERRGFFKLNAMSLLCTLGALVVILAALGAVVAVPVALNIVGLGAGLGAIIDLARWPLLLAVIVLALAVLYRFGPSRRAPQWRWVSWGSGFAALAWVVGSMLFSWYVSHFGTYNEAYGSLGAVIGFMTWIWISTIIVLLGAEISAEMEHKTAGGTTQGRRKPLGSRRASMADDVAR